MCWYSNSKDGNDALVNVNQAHNLEVGDYVMIVNSTSTPSCDGIHKVTKLGDAGQPQTFYIDFYIEECGQSPRFLYYATVDLIDYDDIRKVNVKQQI